MLLEMTRAVQGGLRQEKKMEVVANHLANLDSNGFKKDILSFNSTLQSILSTDFTPGPIRKTDNILDLALMDKGFFTVQTPQGERYTRDGSFTLNRNNELVTNSGFPVLGNGGPITIKGNNVIINEAGLIEVDGKQAGQLRIVDFADKSGLKKLGASLYQALGRSQPEALDAKALSVKQGALEKPNVNISIEMTKLIESQRMYEAYSKMIQAQNETDNKIIGETSRFKG